MASGQVQVIPATGDASGKGKRILVTALTNGTAITLHTTSASLATDGITYSFLDYMTIDAHNSTVTQRTLFLLWGGTTEPNDLVRVDIPPGLPVVIVTDRCTLTGGLSVKAYCDDATAITVGVQVERYQVA